MEGSRRRFTIGVNLLVYSAAFTTGLGYFVVTHKRLPHVISDPMSEAHSSLARGDVRSAAREYRVAARISTTEYETARKATPLRIQAGDAAAEIDQYLRARDLWPRDPATHRALGSAYSKQGRLGEALRSFEFALYLAPRDGQTLQAMGDALLDHDRHADAEAAFRKAIAVNPSSATAHNSLGVALALSGRDAEAVASFAEAYRLNPSPEIASNLERARTAAGGTPR